MQTKNNNNIFWIALAAILYFCIFIFPNLTGTRDVAMLGVFEHDEFAQYPHVIRMLTPGDTLYQSLRNFVVYLHYYYGYPFYFISAILLLPYKWIAGSGWASSTQWVMLMLRQMVNVLPMLLAAFFVIWQKKKDTPLAKILFSFLFLLTIPAVVENNLWWHPDSLLTLFSVLTLIFLELDDLQFGKYFYLSGVMCALAIGSKILGVLFVLTYLVYLLFGLISRKASIKKLAISAFLFLIVLFACVVISNPLLLLPIERGEIIATFKANLGQSSQGFWVAGNGVQSKFSQITQILNQSYGGLFIFSAAIISSIAGFFTPKRRLKNVLIFSWFIGYMSYFFFFAATIRTHYFLPIILPLYATLLDLLPEDFSSVFDLRKLKKYPKNIVSLLLIVLLLIGFTFNSFKSFSTIRNTLNREHSSPSISLFNEFEKDYISRLPINRDLTIYRDWRAYVPDRAKWKVIYNWDLATYDYIEENQPDILFIERENVLYFSDDSKIAEALNPELIQRMNLFYSDALDGQVVGYHLIIETSFGSVFVSDILYQEMGF